MGGREFEGVKVAFSVDIMGSVIILSSGIATIDCRLGTTMHLKA